MYRIMIVEDEIPVRQTISRIIDWEALGFILVTEASDGQEAIAYLKQNKVDAILTDICMPFMDGIELSKQARRLLPSVKIMILTGYNEFDYAQQAIALNVSHYILKPITAAELSEVLGKVKSELDDAFDLKRRMTQLQQKYVASLEMLRAKFLLNLVEGHLSVGQLHQQRETLQVNIDGKVYFCGILQMKNKKDVLQQIFHEDYQLLEFSVFNVTQEVLQKYGQDLVFFGSHEQIIFILKHQQDELATFIENVEVMSNELIDTVNQVFGLNSFVGLSEAVYRIDDLHYAYQDARAALEYHLLYPDQPILVKSDMEKKSSLTSQKVDELLERMIYAIKIGENDKINEYIHFIFEVLRLSQLKLPAFKTHLLRLSTMIFKTYSDMNTDENEDVFLDFGHFQSVFEMKQIGDMERYYVKLCRSLSDKIRGNRIKEDEDYIKMAQSYILKHFHEPELDMSQVCDYLHLSTSYFTRLFKKQSDMTFVEYLTRVRIDKAKELLNLTEAKIVEISQRVGYDDPHYFSYNFRKQTGITPSDYRKGRG